MLVWVHVAIDLLLKTYHHLLCVSPCNKRSHTITLVCIVCVCDRGVTKLGKVPFPLHIHVHVDMHASVNCADMCQLL